MDIFKFEIQCNGRVIARFLHPGDRDVALDALRDAYEDSRFDPGESRKSRPAAGPGKGKKGKSVV